MGWWLAWQEINFQPVWLDTPFGWFLCVILGVLMLTTLLHLARGLVSVHARTAKTLLVAQA